MRRLASASVRAAAAYSGPPGGLRGVMWNAGGLAVASKDSAERSRSPRAVCTTSSVPPERPRGVQHLAVRPGLAVHRRARDGPGALELGDAGAGRTGEAR